MGHICMIMKGNVGQDKGQMYVVSHIFCVMVEQVTFARKNGEGTVTKLMPPSSLVLSEPRHGLVQGQDGLVWVQASSTSQHPC